MKRRHLLLWTATSAMIVLAALGSQKKPGLLLLEWAGKARLETPPAAILIEMGLKDDKPTPWSGRADISGAKAVHREGYRFRDGDKLIEPNRWEASSHRPVPLPPQNPARPMPPPNPAQLRMKPATVGVVLHLVDVQPEATLTLDAGGKNPTTEVPLKGILAGQTKLLWDGQVAVRRISTATPVATAKTEDDFPAAAYGPDGTLWLAYISYALTEENRRANYMQLPKQPADFKAFYTPDFGDQLFVKYYRDGKWSEPLAMTGPKEDLVRCAVSVEGNGTAWVVYSANRQGAYNLYARPLNGKDAPPKLGPEQRLTQFATPSLSPVLCTDQAGNLHLACQHWSEDGTARIEHHECREGAWTKAGDIIGPPKGGNRWYPALAASADGQVAVAYDLYNDGDYDIHVTVLKSGRMVDYVVAASGRFEARPSLAYDAQGRLWIAYEEGPEKWGKDYGALDTAGNPLYNVRSVRVACLVDGKLFQPVAELPTSKATGPEQFNLRTPRYSYPKLGLDGKGRLWLTYRQKLPTPFGVQPGTEWLTQARRLDGDKWTEPVEIHHSDGLLDSRPALLPHADGGLLVIHNTDGRYSTPGAIYNQIFASVVDLPGEPVEPKLVPKEPGSKDGKEEAEERAAVQHIRDYRVENEGKKYQLVRGEFHRHTEISFDGGGDGSLEDMFRYAIDVAALDWIGNTDHDNGNGREYTWWLTQKYTDAYHVAKKFTPVFAYERSVQYPHGHRNCIFARRGIRTLPRLNEPDPEKRVGNVHADDTKMLYRYLKELDGICASHTSATNMGTDWRDNDPQVEPIVEIYQGDRNSYEYEEAPRAGHDPASKKLPVSIGGWRPAGFLNHALKEKGYRLGFQSSSDHISTHISYCIALAEENSREGIVAALKKRRCYAATDDIIVDVRSGKHLMGEEFKATEAPTLQITVVGTKPLARIDILKDSEVVETVKPGKAEYKGAWTDPKPTAGVHYYYVRVQQVDDELAWGSPLWIDYAP
jgi:hypothetical protein